MLRQIMHGCLLGTRKVVERLPVRFAPAAGKAATKTLPLLENLGLSTRDRQSQEAYNNLTNTHRVAAFEHILIRNVMECT
jgi:hypothetical protein